MLDLIAYTHSAPHEDMYGMTSIGATVSVGRSILRDTSMREVRAYITRLASRREAFVQALDLGDTVRLRLIRVTRRNGRTAEGFRLSEWSVTWTNAR